MKRTFFIVKKPVISSGNEDRRSHTNDNDVNRTDPNLEDRENKFGAQIDTKYVNRVPLKYFCDLEKINFPTKIDLEICCTLQTEMKKLFESKNRLLPQLRQTQKLFFLEGHSYNMSRFFLQKI